MYHSFLIHSSADGHLLLPCPGYYKQCCDEHWGTRVSFPSGFLSVYAQQWDCWIIRQFALEADIPYSSLMMILSQGVGGASFDLVMQICRKLNIDPASLSESNGTE